MGLLAEWKMMRWMGPWANPDTQPSIEARDERITVGGNRGIRMRFFFPKGSPRGCLMMIPGMHFKGLDHPRLNRSAAIAASTGLLVAVPEIEDFTAFSLSPVVLKDARAAYHRLVEHSARRHKIGIMCVSFGTLPAITLASDAELSAHCGGVLAFGGYTNWPEAFGWVIDEQNHYANSLNYPLLYTLLSEYWGERTADGRLEELWTSYLIRTWGTEGITVPQKREIALEMASQLPPEDRTLFLQGCGQAEGWRREIEAAIASCTALDWIDLREKLGRMKVPLIAAHSLNDGISPVSESQRMVAACPPGTVTRCHLTGMMNHSGKRQSLKIFTALTELWTLRCILADIQWISTRPLRRSDSRAPIDAETRFPASPPSSPPRHLQESE